VNFFGEIPGYREAIEREATGRESAFLSIPEFICGVPVSALTLRHVAFISQLSLRMPTDANDLSSEELELLLWILSPDYSSRKSIARTFKRFRHTLRFSFSRFRHGRQQIGVALAVYFADAFADSPPSSGGFQVQYNSWIANHVDALSSEYSWPLEEVLSLPVKVAFQLERATAKRYNPKAILFNNSDKVRLDWLRKKNAERINN